MSNTNSSVPTVQDKVKAATEDAPITVDEIRRLVSELSNTEDGAKQTKEVVLNGRTGAYQVRKNGVVVPGFDIQFLDENKGLSELIRALRWAGVKERDKVAKESQRFLAMAAKIRAAEEAARKAIIAQYTAGLPV